MTSMIPLSEAVICSKCGTIFFNYLLYCPNVKCIGSCKEDYRILKELLKGWNIYGKKDRKYGHKN